MTSTFMSRRRAEHLLDLVSHVEDENRKVADLGMAGGRIGQTLALELRLVQASRDLVDGVANAVQRRAQAPEPVRHGVIRAQDVIGGQYQAAQGVRPMRDAVARKRGVEPPEVALGDPHRQHSGPVVVGGSCCSAVAQHVLDRLGRDLQSHADRTHSDAFRPFPDDLSALRIGQSATAAHV